MPLKPFRGKNFSESLSFLVIFLIGQAIGSSIGDSKDVDPEVTSMAAVELARFGEKIPPSVIARIKQYLLSAKGMSSQVTTILYAVSAMGEDGIEVYRALTEHGSSRMRTVAWQRFLSLSDSWRNPLEWLPALKDRDQGVRKAVNSALFCLF